MLHLFRGPQGGLVLLLCFGRCVTPKQDNTASAGFQVTGTLNRSDFNIGPKFPPAVVSDRLVIQADGGVHQTGKLIILL